MPSVLEGLGVPGLGLCHNSGGCLDTFTLPGLHVPEALYIPEEVGVWSCSEHI